MFCTNCGAKLEDGARFCTSCGAPVPAARQQPATGPAPAAPTVPMPAVAAPAPETPAPVPADDPGAMTMPVTIRDMAVAASEPVDETIPLETVPATVRDMAGEAGAASQQQDVPEAASPAQAALDALEPAAPTTALPPTGTAADEPTDETQVLYRSHANQGAGQQAGYTPEVPFAPAQTTSFAPEPMSPYQPERPKKRGPRALTVVAVIMVLLAIAAVAVVAVLVIRPFDAAPQPAAPAAAATTAAVTTAAKPATTTAAVTAPATTAAASPITAPAASSPAAVSAPAAASSSATAASPAGPAAASTGTFMLPDSSSVYYGASDLAGLSNWDLYVARNEIYARHGRRFNRQDLQDYFNGQAWYSGTISPDDFDDSVLNDCEASNIVTIKSVEEERGSGYL